MMHADAHGCPEIAVKSQQNIDGSAGQEEVRMSTTRLKKAALSGHSRTKRQRLKEVRVQIFRVTRLLTSKTIHVSKGEKEIVLQVSSRNTAALLMPELFK